MKAAIFLCVALCWSCSDNGAEDNFRGRWVVCEAATLYALEFSGNRMTSSATTTAAGCSGDLRSESESSSEFLLGEEIVDDLFEIDVTNGMSSVTLYDQVLVDSANLINDGGYNDWVAGEPKDVSGRSTFFQTYPATGTIQLGLISLEGNTGNLVRLGLSNSGEQRLTDIGQARLYTRE